MAPMRDWLADGSAVKFDPQGNMQSSFDFSETTLICALCKSELVYVNRLIECPGCPVVNDWLQKSREKLRAAQLLIPPPSPIAVKAPVIITKDPAKEPS